MPDGFLDLVFYNGAVRTSENEHIAKLLRKKSKVHGGLRLLRAHRRDPGPGEPVLQGRDLREGLPEEPVAPGREHHDAPAQHQGRRRRARRSPSFYKRVYKLDDVVDVDYYLPGCPPAPEQVKAVVTLIVSGAALPPKGSVVGASDRAVCDDCQRKKEEKKVKQFYRPWQIIQDPEKCLMEQGIICAGSATRSGCGVRCPNSGMPCRGCYGPMPNVVDQGAKIVSAVSSIIDSKDPEEIEKILAGIQDITGYAYRFGMAGSLLQRSIR